MSPARVIELDPARTPNRTAPMDYQECTHTPSSSIFTTISDTTLKQAAEQAEREGSEMPLVMQQLRYKIQLTRLKEGKDELSVEFNKPKTYELTEEEKDRQQKRKLRNREAAQKSRQKKKAQHSKLEEKNRKLTKDRDQMKADINGLLRHITNLQQAIEHIRKCDARAADKNKAPFAGQANSFLGLCDVGVVTRPHVSLMTTGLPQSSCTPPLPPSQQLVTYSLQNMMDTTDIDPPLWPPIPTVCADAVSGEAPIKSGLVINTRDNEVLPIAGVSPSISNPSSHGGYFDYETLPQYYDVVLKSDFSQTNRLPESLPRQVLTYSMDQPKTMLGTSSSTYAGHLPAVVLPGTPQSPEINIRAM